MKKILILSMFCNQEPFLKEENFIRETWAAPIIAGDIPDFEFFGFTASDDGNYHVSYNDRIIRVPADDSLRGTLEKTVKTLRFIDVLGIKYDYVFRTNTSTYINIALLRNFVDTLYDQESIWSGNLFLCPHFPGTPYKGGMYAIGNALLLSRLLVDVLLSDVNINGALDIMRQYDSPEQIYYCFIDDLVIGSVINAWFMRNGINHESRYRTFGLLHYEYSKKISPADVIAIKCRSDNRDDEMSRLADIHRRIESEHSVSPLGKIAVYAWQDRIYYLDYNYKMSFVTRDKMKRIMRGCGVPLI